jgi:hypothetical protein
MEYLSSAHRNQELVKTLERLVVGSLSYWDSEIITITQECVICGSVYVYEQNLGDLDRSIIQPRVNPTEEHVAFTENSVENGDVENLDLLSPVKLKPNVTIPPAAIHPTVGLGVLTLPAEPAKTRTQDAASNNIPPTQGSSR